MVIAVVFSCVPLPCLLCCNLAKAKNDPNYEFDLPIHDPSPLFPSEKMSGTEKSAVRGGISKTQSKYSAKEEVFGDNDIRFSTKS